MLKKRKNIFILLVFVVILQLSFSLPKPFTVLSRKIQTIVIDAGHGGKDTGCNQGTDAEEKKIALKVALLVGEKIEENYKDVKVIYTRKKDVFVDLHERSAIANRNEADLFISIHCNANPNKKAFGSETYVMGMHKTNDNLSVAKRENSVILKEANAQKNYKGFDPNSPLGYIMLRNHQSGHIKSSLNFAQKIQRQFRDHAGRTSRGVHQAGFLVLWETAMPSVLVEIGFLTNNSEEKYLKSEDGQNAISQSIYKAFAKYKSEIEN